MSHVFWQTLSDSVCNDPDKHVSKLITVIRLALTKCAMKILTKASYEIVRIANDNEETVTS